MKSNRTLAAAAACMALLGAGGEVGAAPITITTPFMNLEHDGVNSDGFAVGSFLRIGANSVTAMGYGGTTGFGTTIDQVTGAVVTRSLTLDSSPLLPYFYSRKVTPNPAWMGPWTLNFQNSAGGSANTASVAVSLPAGAQQAPFINSISLSGSSLHPTFSWTPPPGATVNGYRVNIYDKSLIGPGNDGQVTSRNLLPTQTSYTVQDGDFSVPGYAFTPGHNYSIQISLIETKDGTSSNLGNANLQAISRTYADFTPSQAGGAAVNLPVVLFNGAYQFNMAVQAGQTYYIDPMVATGYDYAIGAGDPDFRSVMLPSIGDGLFDIWGFDASGAALLLAHDWLAGEVFDFGANGVDRFRVTGIEADAGLDPANPSAFVTALTFTGAGVFDGTQTPLTEEVPEPPLWASLGIAGVGLWIARRRSPRGPSTA